mmetsp:Transcript_49251/g.130012  ORF Transcript_49251/g.130012 Transcript_49251/m.130012 type:complete len:203 (+) Transcript_49251:181-789(+)
MDAGSVGNKLSSFLSSSPAIHAILAFSSSIGRGSFSCSCLPSSRQSKIRSGRSKWWPIPTDFPFVLVWNFRATREDQMPPSTSTSTAQVLGQKRIAAFCRQYNLRLSRVNQHSRPSLGSPFSSSSKFPSASFTLGRHLTISMAGNWGLRKKWYSGISPLSLGMAAIPLAVSSTSPWDPSLKSGRMWGWENRIASGQMILSST